MIDRIGLTPPVARPAPAAARPGSPAPPGGFAGALEQALRTPPGADSARPLRFSAHAAARLEQRGVAFSPSDHARLAQAVDAAAAKGARDAALLMDGLAMIVNVPNRTVVTLVPHEGTEPAVFTQVDSAVIVGGAASPQSSPEPAPVREAPRPWTDRSGRIQEGF